MLTEKLRKCQQFFSKVSQLIMVDLGFNKPQKKSQQKSSVIFAQNVAHPKTDFKIGFS